MQLDIFNPNINSGATFSQCRLYRYTLWRQFDALDKGTFLFIGLNPSTADEINNDPTVERVERRARSMGFGRLVVCNIFAFRATDPTDMKAHPEPVGAENDAAILEQARKADLVLCAWGAHGQHLQRGAAVEQTLRQAGIALHCLELNQGGTPKHPLYVGYNVLPRPWQAHATD